MAAAPRLNHGKGVSLPAQSALLLAPRTPLFVLLLWFRVFFVFPGAGEVAGQVVLLRQWGAGRAGGLVALAFLEIDSGIWGLSEV